MPEVTVVIPTRDRPHLLRWALRSALGQPGVDLEVVVVDDGSSDPSAVEQAVAGIEDARAKQRRHDHALGVSAARNTGIAEARGEWVAFLDDDDVWAPGKLSSQLTRARDEGTGWVYAGAVEVDANLRLVAGAPPPQPPQVVSDLRRHNAVPAGCSNVVVRADVLGRAGGFDPGLTNQEDWDLWLRLAALGSPSCVPDALVACRHHAANASLNTQRMLAELDVIAARHGVPVDRARHYRWAAWMALAEGRRLDALAHYAGAIRAGDVGSLGRAVVGVVHPGITRRRGRVELDDWAAAARSWLAELIAAGA